MQHLLTRDHLTTSESGSSSQSLFLDDCWHFMTAFQILYDIWSKAMSGRKAMSVGSREVGVE